MKKELLYPVNELVEMFDMHYMLYGGNLNSVLIHLENSHGWTDNEFETCLKAMEDDLVIRVPV